MNEGQISEAKPQTEEQPRSKLFREIPVSLLIILGIIAVSLLIGGAGYHYLGELPWLDALHNAAMILTGMGPVDPMRSSAAKIFVILYALYSAVAFLTMVTVLMTPMLHYAIRAFHHNRNHAVSAGTTAGQVHDTSAVQRL